MDNNKDLETSTNDDGLQGQVGNQPTVEYGNSYTIQEPKRNKKGKKLIIALVVILALIGGGFFALRGNATVQNTIALTTKSPKEYYLSIERSSLDNYLDTYLNNYDKYFNALNQLPDEDLQTAFNVKFNVKLNELITSLLNVEGLDLSSVEANLNTNINKDKGLVKLNLDLNGTSLISSNLYVSIEEKVMYIQIPELNEGYLMISFEDLGLTEDVLGELYAEIDNLKASLKDINITSEDLKTMSKQYFDILLENIKVEDLKKGVSLESNGITTKTTQITTILDGKAFYNISKDALMNIKNDSTMLSVFEAYGSSQEEMKNLIDEALEELKNEKESIESDKTVCYMNVYVDNKGNIVGRTFSVEPDSEYSDEVEFGYYMLNKDSEYGYEIYIESAGERIFEITGDAEKSKDGYTGSFDCSITNMDTDSVEWFDITNFKVDFENVKYLDSTQSFAQGKVKVSSPLFSGMSVFINLDSDGKTYQNYTFGLLSGVTEMASISLQTETLEFKDFKLPDANTESIYNAMTEEVDEYISNIDIEAFMNEISEKLGVNIADLLYSY